MRRVTVAVANDPVLIRGANHVHVLLSKAEAFNTYESADWRDAEGNLYCVSSGPWTDVQIAGVTDPSAFEQVISDISEQYPEFDFESVQVAQAAFQWEGPAMPGRIAAIESEDAHYAIYELGLSPVVREE